MTSETVRIYRGFLIHKTMEKKLKCLKGYLSQLNKNKPKTNQKNINWINTK
jgi:hypothetical protein